MQFYCYVVIPDESERHELKKTLRHHHIPFTEKCDCRIEVEMECMSYKTVERISDAFNAVKHTERGFTVMGDKP